MTAVESTNQNDAAAADAFAAVTAAVPDTVNQDASQNFGNPSPAETQPEQDPAIKYPQWTPPEVASYFGSCFFLLETLRGPHWKVEANQLGLVGLKWTPIFQRHVPYGAGAPGWLNTLMMWLGAGYALKEAIGPAMKEEIRLAKLAKEKQSKNSGQGTSATASTQTAGSAASSSWQGSGGAGNQTSNSQSFVDAPQES